MARQALYAFKMTSQKDLKNGASYHAQQAIELILKYCIYNNKRYRQANSGSKQIFSHDLEKLIRNYCIPYNINVPKKIMKNAKMYTTWEAESRYSLHYSVRIDSILTALEETEQWLVSLKPAYKEKIMSVNKKLNIS